MTDVLDPARPTTPPTAADATRPARHNRPGRPEPRSFRPDIEGLRAIAVVSVVLYHANLGVRGGFVGVDVFFVISGYLITRQLMNSVGRKGFRALPTFYTRRIRRLLPASTVVVVATVIAARIWAPPLQVRPITTDAIFTTFYGLNYRLAWEGTQYLHQNDSVSPLQHFWSLGVEEQFYFVWPVLILFICTLPRRARSAALALGLVVLIGFSYRWSETMTPTNAPWAYFSLQTRAWELALGALVAVSATALTRIPRWIAELAAAGGLIAVIASCFWMSDATQYPGSLAAVPVGGAALVIAAGTGRSLRVERILGEALMQCLGRVSYSWYLWHWPMLILAPSVVGHPLGWQGRIVVVWLSFILAIGSYLYVENPVRLWKLPGNVRWFGVGAALAGTVVAAGLVVLANPPSFVGKGKATQLAQAAIAPGDPTANAAFLGQVKSALTAAMSTTAAPSNLVPAPQHSAGDVPYASKAGCHLDYLVVSYPNSCVFGDPNGTKTVVLFGDSHVEQWEPAFAKAGKALHWKVVNWTKAACPAADISVNADTLNREYHECDQWRAAMLPKIAALKPDLVVAGESENDTISGHNVTPKMWADATIKTLDTLKASTKSRVVFMGDNPVPHQVVPDCVAANLNDVRGCQTDPKHEYVNVDLHRYINPAVADAGYEVVDPQSWICAPSGCPPIVGNVMVYRDASHISVQYAEYLSPLVAAILAAR